MYWDHNDIPGAPDDFESGATNQLPIVLFRGIDREYFVAEESGPVEGFVQKALDRWTQALEIIRPTTRSVKQGKARIEFETVGLKDFLKRFPHPTPPRSPYCLDQQGATADYFQGARFCVACRDRLSLISALSHVQVVRVVPVR